MQVTFATAAPAALVSSLATALCPENLEDAGKFPHLEVIFGDTIRGFKGSFCATSSPEVMAQRRLLTQLYHDLRTVFESRHTVTTILLSAVQQLGSILDSHHFTELELDSLSILAENNPQDRYEEQLTSQKPRRGLVNIGGGSKGLVEIVALSYLEEIINTEANKAAYNQQRANQRLEPLDYIYISDLFDCAAGTSTGSIIAAGLFFNKDGIRYKAHEVAQLYVRCLENIFGQDKRNGSTDIRAAKYKPDGLNALLKIFFKDDAKVGNSFAGKPVHIYAVNKEKEDIIRFNPSSFEDVPLWQAVRASSSAPYYFPHMEFTYNTHTYTATDGGTVINNPAADLVAEEHLTEVYAFGAGTVEARTDECQNILLGTAQWATSFVTNTLAQAEAIQAFKTVMKTMAINQTMSIHSVLRSANDPKGSVEFFAHLNPRIPAGTHLDFSDQPTINKMIDAAMRETGTDVFKRMVTQLGFIMPDTEAQCSTLCFYGGVLRLTTELRHNMLQAIYSLHAYPINADNDSTTDSTSNEGFIAVNLPAAASQQLEDRNKLLLEYIEKGINTNDVKFLATVNLPSDFQTPHDCPKNIKGAIACLKTCKDKLTGLLNNINISDVLIHNEPAEIEKLAANFSGLCNECQVNSDSHPHLPLVASVCAQYVMSKRDSNAGSPTALSPHPGYRESNRRFQEQNGIVTRAFKKITFTTPQSRNIKFFEAINNIIEFLNTPAGTVSPAGSRDDLPRLAGSPTATTPLSPGTAGQDELVRHTAAAEPSEAVPNGFQTMLQNASPEERTAMLIMLQQSVT